MLSYKNLDSLINVVNIFVFQGVTLEFDTSQTDDFPTVEILDTVRGDIGAQALCPGSTLVLNSGPGGPILT